MNLRNILSKFGFYLPDDSIKELSRKEIDQMNRDRAKQNA